MELQQGDVVKLKSGSPPMTVCEYPFKTIDERANPNLATCKWFDAESRLHTATFHIDELEKQ